MTKSDFEALYDRFLLLNLDSITLSDVKLIRDEDKVYCELYYSDSIFDMDLPIVYQYIYAPNLEEINVSGNICLEILKLESNKLKTIYIDVDRVALTNFKLKEDKILENVYVHGNQSVYLSSFLSNQYINKVDILGNRFIFENVFENCSIKNSSIFLSNLVNYSKIKQCIDNTYNKCSICTMNTIPFIFAQENFYFDSIIDNLNLYVKESIHACYRVEINNLSNVKIQKCNLILDSDILDDKSIINTMIMFYESLYCLSCIQKVEMLGVKL